MIQPLLPELSHWFHLTPEDVDGLSSEEVEVYVDAVMQTRKERS